MMMNAFSLVFIPVIAPSSIFLSFFFFSSVFSVVFHLAKQIDCLSVRHEEGISLGVLALYKLTIIIIIIIIIVIL